MEIVAQVHPEGLVVKDGDPPPIPKDFYDGFVLPQHDDSKPLQILFPETVQTNMHFLEEPHLYVVSDEGESPYPTSISVTGLAHMFQEEFDPDAACCMMRNSPKWPKMQYTKNLEKISSISDFTSDKGALLVEGDTVIASLPPRSTFDISGYKIYDILRAMVKNDAKEDAWYIYERALTDDEIKHGWILNGQYKRNRGSFIHHMAELALSGLPFHANEPEMNIFYDFLKNHVVPAGATIFCVEREILHKDADLAGSVDAVFRMPDGSFAIVDWKVSDKLANNMLPKFSKKMNAPFNHLLDADGCGYALQLSLYQSVFETQYNMKISERLLVSLSPTNPIAVSVPYLQPEVDYLLNMRIELTRARAEVSGFKCEITGKTLIDAVRTDDGRLVSERAAKMENLSYTPDMAVREKVDEEVAKYMKPVEYVNPPRRNWRRLYDAHNTAPFSQ